MGNPNWLIFLNILYPNPKQVFFYTVEEFYILMKSLENFILKTHKYMLPEKWIRYAKRIRLGGSVCFALNIYLNPANPKICVRYIAS